MDAVGEEVAVGPRLAEQSAAVFAEMVTAHLPFLSAVAVQEVGANDAEDVVQEALIRAWGRRATYDAARGSVRSWLVAIVLDRARRHRTRRQPRTYVTIDESSSAFREDRDQPTTAETRMDLQRAIEGLPRRQRQVVVVHYLAGLTVRETGQVLGISDGTVKSTLSDARRALLARLEES